MSKKDNDLTGFKDFLEGDKSLSAKQYKKERHNGDAELFTFLEQDSKRIERHLKLYEEKAYMLKEYPQEIELMIQLEEHKNELRSQIVTKLKEQNSPLMKSLAELFNPHFRS
jgi:hypothetical protein